MFLVLLETSGNQNYIFATNKLRENIGASELTFRSGSTWVLDAIGELTGQGRPTLVTSQAIREFLRDTQRNPKIEESTTRFEVIIATSGKALILTKEEGDAKALIQAVTLRALKEAPGLEMTGVYKEFSWANDPLGRLNSEVHKLHILARAQKPSTDLRFLRLPVVAPCATSGWPAATLLRNPETKKRDVLASASSDAKQKVSKEGRERIEKLDKTKRTKFAEDVNDLEKTEKIKWLAVIHADGNGLGEIFLKFDQHLGYTTAARNRDYINDLRRFSIALDQCTENAFLAALDNLRRFPRTEQTEPMTPLVPLILGGDDLTVVCEGETALTFTAEFLRVFEIETARTNLEGGIIPKLAEKALGVPRLSACAGIAMVKLHFPFSVAYELAEALMQVAKTVKTYIQNTQTNTPYPCSALDFHVLYDSSDVDLSLIRQKLQPEPPEQTHLYNRPFVVTPLEDLETSSNPGWAKFHHWHNLLEQVEILTAKNPQDPGKRAFPNSQAHTLRQELFRGKEVANGYYKLIRERYPDSNIRTLGTAESSDSLFAEDPNSKIWVTALIDAIDAADFLQTAPETVPKSAAR